MRLLRDRIIFFTRQPGKIKADISMDFKEGKRFLRKEDLLSRDGYVDMEKMVKSKKICFAHDNRVLMKMGFLMQIIFVLATSPR